MKVFKNVVSFILSMVLMFSFIIAVFAGFTKNVLFNKTTYLNIMEQEDIYGKVTESILDNIDYAMTVNNISSEYGKGVM